MSAYFFRITNGKFTGVSESSFDLADGNAAAWAEMTKICGNMVGSLCHNLKPKADWRMDLLDASRKPVFRIRLVAESLGRSNAQSQDGYDCESSQMLTASVRDEKSHTFLVE
jgi:hypothetical protein